MVLFNNGCSMIMRMVSCDGFEFDIEIEIEASFTCKFACIFGII